LRGGDIRQGDFLNPISFYVHIKVLDTREGLLKKEDLVETAQTSPLTFGDENPKTDVVRF
jgi:hypothetical protein